MHPFGVGIVFVLLICGYGMRPEFNVPADSRRNHLTQSHYQDSNEARNLKPYDGQRVYLMDG